MTRCYVGGLGSRPSGHSTLPEEGIVDSTAARVDSSPLGQLDSRPTRKELYRWEFHEVRARVIRVFLNMVRIDHPRVDSLAPSLVLTTATRNILRYETVIERSFVLRKTELRTLPPLLTEKALLLRGVSLSFWALLVPATYMCLPSV